MVREISIEEVKKHRDSKSVWIIIHNDVYDVTNFLEEHPGGEDSLLGVAGEDGTQSFEDVGHSADARDLLKKYKIGTLPQSEIRNKVAEPDNSRSRSPKPERNLPCSPRPEKRIQRIVVPRERTQRRSSSSSNLQPPRRTQSRSPSPPRSSKLKWAILALAGAIIVGVVLRKYLR